VLVAVGLTGIVIGVPVAFALAFGAFAAFAPLGQILLVTISQNMAPRSTRSRCWPSRSSSWRRR
jgi:ABC-type spermidine/putrescine transport system permease subunit I